MKKFFIIQVVVIMGLLFWAGCVREAPRTDRSGETGQSGSLTGSPPVSSAPVESSPSNQNPENTPIFTSGDPTPEKVETVTPAPQNTEASPPAESPAASPEAVPTKVINVGPERVIDDDAVEKPPHGEVVQDFMPVNQLKYLQGGVVLYSLKADPGVSDFIEEKTLKFPIESMVVALKVGRTGEAPEGKTMVVSWYNQNKKSPILSQDFASGDIQKQDMMFLLTLGDEPLPGGPYRVEIVEKESGKKMIRNFAVLGDTANVPAEPPRKGEPGGGK